MKTAFALFVLGLVVGLVVPYYLQDIISGAGIQLPQFFWSKSPPIQFSVNIPVFFRVMGIVLMLLAFVRFILVRGKGKV